MRRRASRKVFYAARDARRCDPRRCRARLSDRVSAEEIEKRVLMTCEEGETP